ncbi:MAG: helix-turn-helix domain-containing protein [Chloroflexota bacterium]
MTDRRRPSAGPSPQERAAARPKTPLPRGSAARPVVLPEPYRYTIADLEQRTGLTARTIRYYIQEGLLPPAYGRGPSATYDHSHMLRLEAIEKLKGERLTLSEIRDRLVALSDSGIAGLMGVAVGPDPAAEVWRRIALHPDLEVLVRVDRSGRAAPELESFVERIAHIAHAELPQE